MNTGRAFECGPLFVSWGGLGDSPIAKGPQMILIDCRWTYLSLMVLFLYEAEFFGFVFCELPWKCLDFFLAVSKLSCFLIL